MTPRIFAELLIKHKLEFRFHSGATEIKSFDGCYCGIHYVLVRHRYRSYASLEYHQDGWYCGRKYQTEAQAVDYLTEKLARLPRSKVEEAYKQLLNSLWND